MGVWGRGGGFRGCGFGGWGGWGGRGGRGRGWGWGGFGFIVRKFDGVCLVEE